jgi:hypothetical protein
MAGLWATKLAVACGSSESISKLFSTQRRRIYALEQRTAEAQMNNEAEEKAQGIPGWGWGWWISTKKWEDFVNRMDGLSVEQKT